MLVLGGSELFRLIELSSYYMWYLLKLRSKVDFIYFRVLFILFLISREG